MVSGCWFHYTQAVMKRLKKIGLYNNVLWHYRCFRLLTATQLSRTSRRWYRTTHRRRRYSCNCVVTSNATMDQQIHHRRGTDVGARQLDAHEQRSRKLSRNSATTCKGGSPEPLHVPGYLQRATTDCDARLAFVPRGHQRFCASCVAQLEQQARGCPICRTDINMVLRLY